MNRFVTLGISSDDHIHLVQLQYENDKYAELRSIERLGHENRQDTEVQQEEAEREEREMYRDMLLKELVNLKMHPEEHPEHKMQLKSKLQVLERADQQRKLRNQEVEREINLIYERMRATGKITSEQN